jgi:predicted ArsR family transcriptional regulator
MSYSRTAKDVLYELDKMYHQTNRGRGIGGWQVTRFEPGLAEVENNTAHHCAMLQGMMTEALLVVGTACNVIQTRCFLEGADTCIYQVTSAFVDARWGA